uniref:Methyltransferase type 11 n=1 Tax=uncultured marine thaumarchaeote KM3_64_C01 TaxID=1456221 RepID=A0A075HF23_9ARCH|nr:hypothetical protein [uncultured marine thaumarchaeote KM3_64_C01]
MDKTLAEAIVTLKTEFMKRNEGDSHIHEIIPTSPELLSINEHELKMLHKFAESNSIYSDSYEMEMLDTVCRVYQGDVNNYWLDSIKHDTSYVPFYPVWILSAYALALESKSLGAKQIIDIGSGDGRIAYCAKVAGLQSFAIEIDENLVSLENKISSNTGVDFQPMMADATQFDYASLELSQPIFFIAGLPEVGEMLANSVIPKITSIPSLKMNPVFVFTGSHIMRKDSRDKSMWGWGKLIDHYNLKVIKTVTLPTYWTLDQQIDTPFIFTKSMI